MCYCEIQATAVEDGTYCTECCTVVSIKQYQDELRSLGALQERVKVISSVRLDMGKEIGSLKNVIVSQGRYIAHLEACTLCGGHSKGPCDTAEALQSAIARAEGK